MKYRTAIIVGILLISLIAFIITRVMSQVNTNRYAVKMYSGEKVIATWTARDFGRIDGETLIFTIGGDFEPVIRQVRISGTYTVEQIEP
jgi:hypothetical protein